MTNVCTKAEKSGLEISLEFLPSSNIATLADALEIINLVESQNIGICLDSWHFFRGENEIESLSNLKPGQVNLLQMNDGTLIAENNDYIEDCLTNRRLFGQGEFPLDSFMAAIDALGYSGPVSIEIMSAELANISETGAAMSMTKSYLPFNLSD